MVIVLLAALGFGYLLGSIPCGYVLTRAAGLGDIRAIGSHSIGATNVLRTGRKGLAVATVILDALKGTMAAVLAGVAAPALAAWATSGASVPTGLATLAYAIPVLAGAGALVGHIFPVWLGFQGGKGIATFIGVLLAVAWPLAVVFCGIWLLVAAIWRMSSLSSLVATLAVTAVVALWGVGGLGVDRIGLAPETMVALRMIVPAMSLLLIWKHRSNIRRLLAGEEPRIGVKSGTAQPG